MSWSGKVYSAIFEGNVKAARELLAPDQLTNFNLEGRHGVTVTVIEIYYAFLINIICLVLFFFLLSKYEEATLLMIAANECQVEIANLLLDAGACIHTRDRVR